jgi:hypothetical protein
MGRANGMYKLKEGPNNNLWIQSNKTAFQILLSTTII